MADTDAPKVDFKLPDGTQFKGSLQDAMSSLPNSMQPDLQRIGADMAQRNPANPSPPGSTLDMARSHAEDLTAKAEAAGNKQQELQTPIYDQLEQANKQLGADLARGPRTVAQPEVPKLKPEEITPVFGALMAFAALAGTGARNHAVGALNAMNGVMEGVHTGNKELYDRSLKEYEAKSKQALAAQAEADKQYKAIIDNDKYSIEDKQEALKIAAFRAGNYDMAEKIANHAWDKVITESGLEERAGQKFEIAKNKFSDDLAKSQAIVTDDDLRMIAAQMRSDPGAIRIVGAYDRITKQRLAHIYVEEANKAGKSPQEIVAAQKAILAETGAMRQAESRVVAVERLQNSIDNLGPMLKDLAERGLPDGVKAINKPINWLRRNLSDEDLSKLDLLTVEIPTQYQEAMTMPGSNAQMHEGARVAGQVFMNSDMTLGQVMGNYKVMTEILKSNDAALKKIVEEEKKKIANEGSSSSDAIREFATEAEAEAAGLKPGTKVKVAGKLGTWQ